MPATFTTRRVHQSISTGTKWSGAATTRACRFIPDRTTIEPSSIVFVPLAGGFDAAVRTPPHGGTAGTTGSSAPSLSGRHPAAAWSPPARSCRPPPPPMVVSPMAFGADGRAIPAPRRRLAVTVRVSGCGHRRVASPAARAPKPRTPAGRRRQTASSSSSTARAGSAAARPRSSTRRRFTRIGDLHGLPVYTARGREATIFVPVAARARSRRAVLETRQIDASAVAERAVDACRSPQAAQMPLVRRIC